MDYKKIKNYEVEVPLETSLERASTGLKKKIQYSIDLLRKAKDLALKYSSDGYYLAFSGGKDSQALYHVAKLAEVPFRAYMNLTSIDPPQVILFVKRNYPKVVLNKPIDSIYNISVRKYLLPSRIIRWCCQVLKEGGGAGTVCLTGIRKAESTRRAKRSPVEVSNRSFAGDFEQFHDWQADQIKKKFPNLNIDQFAERGAESEVRCVNGKDKIIINPIMEWSDRDVWEFLNKVVRVPHCELYDMGWHRIGCICCPMSNYRHKVKELQMFPHVKRNWIRAIRRIREMKIGDNVIVNNYWGDGSEDEKCEQIFNWWISGKSYERWYADEIQQLKIDFKQ